MNAFLVVAEVLGVALIVVLLWGGRKTKAQNAALSKGQVEAALENLISDDSCCHDAFDLFLAFPINDGYLESVRKRCIEIAQKYPGEPGQDISPEGGQQIAMLLRELHAQT